ncbi:MAG: hypothetical protein WBV85_05770 [Solirubrobacteraceae bacterium]
MSDGASHTAKLRDRLTTGTEDKLGRALADLLDNPIVTGTIGRAFDARERASQAQELAFGALNIPTAADIERLTRRLRSVSQRLEGIEDGVHRLNRALTEGSVERRLAALEEQLKVLSNKLSGVAESPSAETAPSRARRAPSAAKTSSVAKKPAATTKPSAKKPATNRASSAPKGTSSAPKAASSAPKAASSAPKRPTKNA